MSVTIITEPGTGKGFDAIIPSRFLDPHPVGKLFTPDAGVACLLTEAGPDDPEA